MIAHPDRSVKARILLASASPRRRDLIKLLGLPVDTTAADIDEVPLPDERAAAMALRLSVAKAQAGLASLRAHPERMRNEVKQESKDAKQSPTFAPEIASSRSSIPLRSIADAPRNDELNLILLASDTVVSLDGEPLGKPRDAADARLMLQRLRNRTHQVYTGIALIDTSTDRLVTDLAGSDVCMRDYSDEEIEDYIVSGDPFDKAGAYAIQHTGFHPADRFDHCFANVMGLPLCHVVRALRRLGVEPINDVPALCQNYLDYQCPVYEKILEEETGFLRS